MPPYTAGDRPHAAVATHDTDASACVLDVTNSGRAQKNVLAGRRKAIVPGAEKLVAGCTVEELAGRRKIIIVAGRRKKVAGRRKSYCSGRAQKNSGRAQINSGRAQKKRL